MVLTRHGTTSDRTSKMPTYILNTSLAHPHKAGTGINSNGFVYHKIHVNDA